MILAIFKCVYVAEMLQHYKIIIYLSGKNTGNVLFNINNAVIWNFWRLIYILLFWCPCSSRLLTQQHYLLFYNVAKILFSLFLVK